MAVSQGTSGSTKPDDTLLNGENSTVFPRAGRREKGNGAIENRRLG